VHRTVVKESNVHVLL